MSKAEQKLDKVNKLLALIKDQGFKKSDAEKFFAILVKKINDAKGELTNLSDENINEINEITTGLEEKNKDAIIRLDDFLQKGKESLEESISKLDDKLPEVDSLIKKIKAIKPPKDGIGVKDIELKEGELLITLDDGRVFDVGNINGEDGDDGNDADEDKIIERILKEIELPEIEYDGEEIVEAINDLPVEPKKQIDAKHIKNLPQSKSYGGGGAKNAYQINYNNSDSTLDSINVKDALDELDSEKADVVDNIQVVYVGKHGDDSNSGKTNNEAFLNFRTALSYVSEQNPSSTSRWIIQCFDGGTYLESLEIPQWVGVIADGAFLYGNHTMQDNTYLQCGSLGASSGNCISKTKGTGTAFVNCPYSNLEGTAKGIYVSSGKISYKGFSLFGTSSDVGFHVAIGGNIEINVNGIDLTNAYQVDFGGVAHIFCTDLNGTQVRNGDVTLITANAGIMSGTNLKDSGTGNNLLGNNINWTGSNGNGFGYGLNGYANSITMFGVNLTTNSGGTESINAGKGGIINASQVIMMATNGYAYSGSNQSFLTGFTPKARAPQQFISGYGCEGGVNAQVANVGGYFSYSDGFLSFNLSENGEILTGADYGQAWGREPVARQEGHKVFSLGSFNDKGDAQTVDTLMRMELEPYADGVMTIPVQYIVPEDTTISFEISINIRANDGTSAFFKKMILLENTGGIVSQVGTVQDLITIDTEPIIDELLVYADGNVLAIEMVTDYDDDVGVVAKIEAVENAYYKEVT